MPRGSNDSVSRPQSSDWEAGRPVTRKAFGTCRDLIKSLGQTIKLIGLYNPGHPVPAASLQESLKHMGRIFKASGKDQLLLSVAEGRFLVNGAVYSEASEALGIIIEAFKRYEIDSVSFRSGVLIYELGALAELLAVPPNRAGEIDAPDYLKQKGARRIRIDAESYSRSRPGAAAEPVRVESPIRKRAPGTDGKGPASVDGFGSFIRRLVEGAVADPDERAAIYTETLRMVKHALERRVHEETRRLRLERQKVLNEQTRTEAVLGAAADGRVVVDKDGKVLMMDPAAEQIIGKRLADVAGQPLFDHVESGEHAAALARDIEVDAERAVSREVRVSSRGGAAKALRGSTAIVQDEYGRIVGTYNALPHAAKYREAEKLREDFVSQVTHELKAPLSSICSALEIIDEGAAGMGEQERKFIGISRRNSEKLRGMIDDLLDFSKLESGELSVRPVPTPAGPILHEAVEGLRPWAESRKLELTMEEVAAEEGPSTLADHGRIVQVLTNLISNAIKNTPEGGSIRVSVARDGEAVRFSVEDTGRGIPKEEQESIFKKFMQGRSNGGRREGVGLGLHISARLLELHGSKLTLESEEGRGARFSFGLPCASGKKGGESEKA